jgi:O-antigen/teichoic acid export membrane protein
MSDPPASDIPEQAHYADTLARGSALAFASQAVGGICTTAIVLFLTRHLGPSTYGIYALALSIVAMFLLPSDFGISASLPRFIAEHRGDRSTVADLLADAIRLKLLGALVFGGGIAALASVIAGAYGEPSLAWPLRFAAIVMVGQGFLFMLSGVFGALRRQGPLLAMNTAESVTELSATVALVLLAGGATAAAAGSAMGYMLGTAAGFVLAARLLGRRMFGRGLRPQQHARRIAGYASSLLIVDGAFTAFGQVDLLLIGAFLTSSAVGFWQAPLRLILLLSYPGLALTSAVVPRLARSAKHVPEIATFAGAIRGLIVLMAAICAVTTVWASPIVRLALGPSFAMSAEVLRALAPFVFLSGLGPLISGGMNIAGIARRRIPITVATVLVNLGLDLVLIPRIGILGAAIGTDVAFLIYVPAHFLYCRQALGLPLRPVAITLARSLLAGVAMGLVLLAFGYHRLTIAEAVVGSVAGVAVFVAVLLATREISIAELTRARRFVTRSSAHE